MRRGAISQCLGPWCRSYSILNNFARKYSTKSKLTFSGKFGKLLVLLESP
jgi:hypothetical protein